MSKKASNEPSGDWAVALLDKLEALSKRIAFLERIHEAEIREQRYRDDVRETQRLEKERLASYEPSRVRLFEDFRRACFIEEADAETFQWAAWQAFHAWREAYQKAQTDRVYQITQRATAMRNEAATMRRLESVELEEQAAALCERAGELERTAVLPDDHLYMDTWQEGNFNSAMAGLYTAGMGRGANGAKLETWTGVRVAPKWRHKNDLLSKAEVEEAEKEAGILPRLLSGSVR
jgi:hypothetical protein